MKTNHARGFTAKSTRHNKNIFGGTSAKSEYADKTAGGHWNGSYCGSSGERRAKAGVKKFIRTRIRAAEKMQLQKESNNE